MSERDYRTPEEPKRENFHGQEVVTHTLVRTFTEAMRTSRPERVFSFAQHIWLRNIDQYSPGVLQQQSFLAPDSRVHQFFTILQTNEQAGLVAGALNDAMQESGVEELDGSVKVDPKTGHVYSIYETDTTISDEFDQKQASQIRSWKRDVAKLGDRLGIEPVRSYLTNGEDPGDPMRILDFAYGKHHLVTVDTENENGQSDTSLYTTLYEVRTVARTPEATPFRWTFPLSLQSFKN